MQHPQIVCKHAYDRCCAYHRRNQIHQARLPVRQGRKRTHIPDYHTAVYRHMEMLVGTGAVQDRMLHSPKKLNDILLSHAQYFFRQHIKRALVYLLPVKLLEILLNLEDCSVKLRLCLFITTAVKYLLTAADVFLHRYIVLKTNL